MKLSTDVMLSKISAKTGKKDFYLFQIQRLFYRILEKNFRVVQNALVCFHLGIPIFVSA